ncbi:MAG TPA: amino acid ABC transporter permease [Stellaceae bacterium]|nr:amino acid ABC transporter permease [Stellaceae bacterium]
MIGSGHLFAYLLLLVKGAGITLELCFAALIFGSLGGVVVGAMRTTKSAPLRVIGLLYVEIVRSIPFVILLFFIFFAVPMVVDIDIPPYPAAIAALSLNCSAYMAEVVRSGIRSVPIGQWEAARSLGLSYFRIMRHVVLPQALRVMIPPTIGVYVNTIKESSLASIIGFVELLGQGMAIREARAINNPADVLLAVAFGYFVICFTLSRLGRELERRTSRDLRPVPTTIRTARFAAWRRPFNASSGPTGNEAAP